MTESALHPLARLTSIDELLALPYFEILACLTSESLHPGGGAATQLLLDNCRLRPVDRVLEIGCGPGWTTRALVRAGLDVRVVERSPLMVEAMRYHCGREGLAVPPTIVSGIEAFARSRPFDTNCDVILLECVVGFVADHGQLARAIGACLSNGGRVGVLDLHYTSPPPTFVLDKIERITGHRIRPMNETDWRSLFSPLHCRTLQSFGLPSTAMDSAARIIAESEISRWMPDVSTSELAKLERFLDRAAEAFAENKSYMSGHLTVYEGGLRTAHV